MARKVYVYRNGEMVEKHLAQPLNTERVHDIMPDLPDFVSTVDGSVINGRRGLREHNKRHNVTNPADFTNHWANFQKQREKLFTGQDNSRARTEAIARAFNDLQERNRRSS